MARAPNASRQARALFAEMLKTPGKWRYGYERSRQTSLLSGTLYPLLIRLSDQGLLEAKWEEPEKPGKPPRHAYRLTSDGMALRGRCRRKLPGQPCVIFITHVVTLVMNDNLSWYDALSWHWNDSALRPHMVSVAWNTCWKLIVCLCIGLVVSLDNRRKTAR
jgi:PadR family transcriptional regulator PadR